MQSTEVPSIKLVITRFYSIIEIVGACYITKTAGWHILLTDSQRHTYSIPEPQRHAFYYRDFRKLVALFPICEDW